MSARRYKGKQFAPPLSAEDRRIVYACFAASTTSAYLSGVAVSVPLVALDFGGAKMVQNLVFSFIQGFQLLYKGFVSDFLFGPALFWALALPFCVLLSSTWVFPIAERSQRSVRFRVSAAACAGATASITLYISLAHYLDRFFPVTVD